MRRVEIAESVESISGVKDQRTLVNRMIQVSLDRVFEYFDWPYYIQRGTLTTTDDYTTGHATVTSGSASVTGDASTVWTTSMEGRKIRIGTDKTWYTILDVTAVNALTLTGEYRGSDQTDADYIIYQDEYRLAPDVDKTKTMLQMQNGVPLYEDSPSNFDRLYSSTTSLADPTIKMIIGTKLDTYTTGTVSASGTTITGVGTSWTSVEGLGRCSKIRIGNNVYTVKSLDSATQITTYETTTTAAAGSSYEITLDNLRIQLYPIPNDDRLIYYRYFRKPAILANDYDQPDMPERWHHILIWGTLSEVLSQKGDINKAENLYESRFIKGLEQMKIKIGSFTPEKRWVRKSVDGIRKSNRGFESADYDARYSRP